jgi:predicted RNA-binding protein (virulence factor B family)
MSEERLSKKWVAGTRKTLQVLRQKQHGYYVGDGWREVLLPNAEVIGTPQVDKTVDVFVYHDSEDRWVATMHPVKMEHGQIGLLEVVDVHPQLGVFLDIGIRRQLFLPYGELPQTEYLRPKKGDSIYVKIVHDAMGRMLAHLAGEPELAPLCVAAPATWKNTWVEATVYNTMKEASFVVCDAGVLGYGVIGMVHMNERIRPLRIGDRVRLRVVHVREDGRVNLSMREPMHIAQSNDADKLYLHLKTRGGFLPYGDHTDPATIQQVFQISKGAFKRAIGLLIKQGKIRLQDNCIYAAEEGGRHE